MKENDPRTAVLEQRLRREASSLPGPAPDLAGRIVRSIHSAGEAHAKAPASETFAWRRPALLGAVATAAGILLWLGAGRRTVLTGPADPPVASELLTRAAELDLREVTRASSGQLRSWVDEPLLREVEQWVELGNQAASRYVSLVPSVMRSPQTREG